MKQTCNGKHGYDLVGSPTAVPHASEVADDYNTFEMDLI